jgi:uncharacterized protein (DUF427 family)
MDQRRSLIHEYPDHTVEFEPNPKSVRAEFGGVCVAESSRSVLLKEADYPAVIYMPIEDLRAEFIEPTDHHTFCPFKGEASYWNLRTGDTVGENVIWGYPEPFEEVDWLKGLVAFFSDRVDLKVGND